MTTPGRAQRAVATTLRRLRGRLSQAHLAERIHHSREYVSAVERCRRWPSREFIDRCDAALGANGELAALWPALDAERRRRAAASRPRPRAPSTRTARTRRPSTVDDRAE